MLIQKGGEIFERGGSPPSPPPLYESLPWGHPGLLLMGCLDSVEWEWWNGGIVEWWNGGIVEWWNGFFISFPRMFVCLLLLLLFSGPHCALLASN